MLDESKKLIFETFVLIILVLSASCVSTISDSVSINVIETKKLDLTFIPIDNPNNFNENVQDSANFFNRTYPVSNDGLIVHIGNAYSMTEKEKDKGGWKNE